MDKSDFFPDKKYFVQADGQGIRLQKNYDINFQSDIVIQNDFTEANILKKKEFNRWHNTNLIWFLKKHLICKIFYQLQTYVNADLLH